MVCSMKEKTRGAAKKGGRGESMDMENAFRQTGFLPLAEGLFYFPCGDAPLSAEVFLIPGRECAWFFDCGNGEHALNAIRAVPGRKRAVISHFHPDHMGNVHQADFERVYLGDFAYRKAGDNLCAVAVTACTAAEDAIDMHILPLPSCHAKGSLMLTYGKYVFLGDGIYAGNKNGQRAYNATVLWETIRALEGVSAQYAVLSHRAPEIVPCRDVLAELKAIYAKREKNAAYILL